MFSVQIDLQSLDINKIHEHFAQLGAILTNSADDADLIAEVASGCLGTEYKSFIVGIPSIPVPGSTIPTPEAAILRSVEQTGIMKPLRTRVGAGAHPHERPKHFDTGAVVKAC